MKQAVITFLCISFVLSFVVSFGCFRHPEPSDEYVHLSAEWFSYWFSQPAYEQSRQLPDRTFIRHLNPIVDIVIAPLIVGTFFFLMYGLKLEQKEYEFKLATVGFTTILVYIFALMLATIVGAFL